MVAAVTSERRGRKSGGRRPVVKSMEGNTWNRLFVREGGGIVAIVRGRRCEGHACFLHPSMPRRSLLFDYRGIN